ncbi:hypothetical protein [Achromobacter kerstersii]|uniref:hypothetical protein n=1 Tax=Achromobacter kerstersii TaxID=1353890 RepID=UPI00320B29F7
MIRAIELEYRLHRIVIQAAGTKVMLGFGSAGRFFHSKGIGARVGFDQGVAVSLGTASFKFSNLVFKLVYASQQRTLALGGLNSILLHGDYLSPKLYELAIQFIGGRNDLRLIQRLCSRTNQTDSLCGRVKRAHDVHKSSPNVEKGGVGTPDSTLRGNAGEKGA